MTPQGRKHPSCPLHCALPDDVVEVPRPRHAWDDVMLCPNDDCDRAFMVRTHEDAS
jgi:hypothetical protein